ncbi:MAG: ATP-binding protein [Flammeovirgaceae bacterium]|nr:ATP-binding protein [Flammeovirgaceae bacterium]
MINRVYLAELERGLKQFPAVALLGPRQIGKSTLALTLANKLKKKVVFLDLEKNSDRNKLLDAESFFKAHESELVIIDEVQIIPTLFTELRPAIDGNRKSGRFLLLGSASPDLVKGVSESLAGRIQYIELPSITVMEAAKNSITANTLWIRGGFPSSLTAGSLSKSLLWRQQLIRSFVERDLTLLFGSEISVSNVRNFWQMLAHQQGGIWNAQKISNSLGVSGPTVKRYLHFLEGAFLVRSLEPWFVNTSKRLVKSPKIYVRDTGLLHALLNIHDYPSLLGHPVAGASWEGFVIEQIIQGLPEGIRPFFYRTHHGAEADLVLVKGIQPVAAIEIKLNNTPVVSKGFYQTLEDMGLRKGYVITPDSDAYSIGLAEVYGLKAFLEKILTSF